MGQPDYIFQVNRLYKSFRVKKVLKDLSLALKNPEIFGLLGINGAGKTTLLRCVLGLLHPDAGEIFFRGELLNPLIIRSAFSFLPENFSPPANLNAGEFLACLNLGLGQKDNIKDILEEVGLGQMEKQRISTFSKGMLQRLGLAACFLGNPLILFLDEPLSGLDPIGQREILNLISNFKKQGKTVFFSSHILSHVEKVCDRIGVISEGRLRFQGELSEFLAKHSSSSLEEAFFKEIGQ